MRQQEDALYAAESELAANRSELTATRLEVDALRTQLAQRGESTILPEQAHALYRATGIRINKLRSGGLDNDDQPGDDEFLAVVTPHDADGELIKVPGDIELELYDMALPEKDRRIGQWEFGVGKAHNNWQSGLMGAGYQFKVPWQQQPTNSELVLHARLRTTDGRSFDASEPIVIEPPTGNTALSSNASTRHSTANVASRRSRPPHIFPRGRPEKLVRRSDAVNPTKGKRPKRSPRDLKMTSKGRSSAIRLTGGLFQDEKLPPLKSKRSADAKENVSALFEQDRNPTASAARSTPRTKQRFRFVQAGSDSDFEPRVDEPINPFESSGSDSKSSGDSNDDELPDWAR